MKGDRFTKVMLVCIFFALVLNLMKPLFSVPRVWAIEPSAVPPAKELAAQSRERVESGESFIIVSKAIENMAQSNREIAQALRDSNQAFMEIASALRENAKATHAISSSLREPEVPRGY